MNFGSLFASMQVYICVVETGSFSECARRLGLSQPSVSRQINNLEHQLGVRLLQRTTRRISMTEAGRVYYSKAKRIQSSVDEANQSISGFKESPSGTLRVSVPHTWVDMKIAPHLGDFLAEYPNIDLDLQCSDTRQDIVAEQLDIVIRIGHANNSSYIAVPLSPVNIMVVAAPSYFEQRSKPLTFTDLSNHHFITFNQFDTLLYKNGEHTEELKVKSRIRTNSVSTMIKTTKQGIGVSILPQPLISEELKNGQLLSLLGEDKISLKGLVVEEAFAMYSSRKQMPAKVRAFLDFFKNRF